MNLQAAFRNSLLAVVALSVSFFASMQLSAEGAVEPARPGHACPPGPPEPPPPRRPDAPALARPGLHAAGVTTLVLPNQQEAAGIRDQSDEFAPGKRKLTVELWYPADAPTDSRATYLDHLGSGPGNPARPVRPFCFQGRAARDAPPADTPERAPRVVVSHGWPGSRVLMSHLGEHLATHGFVVAAIDHPGSTHADRNEFIHTLRYRADDIRVVLDHLQAPASSRFPENLPGPTAGAAVIGYSMGGYGALVAAGAGVDPAFATEGIVPEAVLAPHLDGNFAAHPGIAAVVALAPWGGPAALAAAGLEGSLWSPESLRSIAVPVLYVGGTADEVSGYTDGVRWLFQQHRDPSARLLSLEAAGHNVAPNPAPALARKFPREFAHYADPVWDTERVNDLNRHFVLAFLRRHLLDDHDAEALLAPWSPADAAPPEGFDGLPPRGVRVEAGTPGY